MNREQMIAWLTLEGYRPYNAKGSAVAFTLSADGKRGVWCDSVDVGNVNVYANEVIQNWDDVPTNQLERAYAQLLKEKDHAS